MNFSFDSWPWKIALVLGLLGAREFVRLLSPKDTPQNTEGDNGRWLIETIDSATIAIGLVLFIIQPFILQAFYIPSSSMENTLLIGDRLLVSKVVYRVREPQSGDVIVFHAPPEAHPPAPDDDFIKRCIGTPGHRIEAKNRTIYIDGQPDNEPYQKWDANEFPGYDMKILNGVVYSREYTQWEHDNHIPAEPAMQVKLSSDATHSDPIPTGKLLMLGDHRNNSNDGHVWGLLDENRIVGKAVCVFWPGTRLGLVDRMSERVQTPDLPMPAPNPAPHLAPDAARGRLAAH